MMLQPEKEVGPSPGVWQSLRSILLASWLNFLLLFIPIFVHHRLRILTQCSHANIVGSPFRLRWFIYCYYTPGPTLTGLLNATHVGASHVPPHLRFSEPSSSRNACVTDVMVS
ncbi:hypothetical protein ARMGADRAFT_27988 [Armillaria gallica]|uniref:Uncharacterized protein n=1 Tax=Armillaria gallica TaxID=47427 RepID=A0A2H3ETE0_ARMGA|nr:hypothetical protein ARMGADRAFT_27988 [Armillaria gallica]